MKRGVIVGGGISGIAAAAQLAQRGIEPVLLESEPLLGGRIGTRRHQNAEIDLGGRNFTANDRHLLKLLSFFGISEFADYRFNSVAAGRRNSFDMRSGGGPLTRAKRFLGNAVNVGPGPLRRLAKVATAARSDAEGGLVGSPYWTRLAEDAADPVATSYFGSEIADQIIRPWTLRMMAAEPEEVYLGNLGPMLGRHPKALMRVQGGMGTFLGAVLGKLNVKRSHKVKAISFVDDRVVGVEGLMTDGTPFREAADLVVVATSAPAAADLLDCRPALGRALRRVVYHPVATVVAEYSDVHFPGNVGGLFLPRGRPTSHIAKYDDDNRVRFSFAGVAARKLMEECTVEEMLEYGEKDFRRFDGRLGRRISFIGEIWRPGLCGHTWMHHETIRSIFAQSEGLHGLALTGDYVRGNTLEACATAALERIARVAPLYDG